MKFAMFSILVGFIVTTSLLDAFVNSLYPPIAQTELNPIASLLISLIGVEAMLLVKCFNTMLVAILMAVLYKSNKKLAFMSVSPIALFQVWLMLFLFC